MNILTEKITISSEYGDRNAPSLMEIRMNGKDMDLPVTFYVKGKAVFSMGGEEISAFCKALQSMNCDP